jgi:RNA polymerase sigma-70 factor (ECF subfamily)
MIEKSSNNLEDAVLVAMVKDGDVDAFGVLYERYLDRIFRYLRLRLTNEHDAEDLTEVVFIRAFEAIGRYEHRGWPFSAYLYQVARNVLADHYRTLKQTSSLENLEPIKTKALPVDELIVQREQLSIVRQALDTLPDDYQEVIRLRVILKMPTVDVAQWLGRSEGAVRVLLYRALRRLRNVIRRMSEESDEGRSS